MEPRHLDFVERNVVDGSSNILIRDRANEAMELLAEEESCNQESAEDCEHDRRFASRRRIREECSRRLQVFALFRAEFTTIALFAIVEDFIAASWENAAYATHISCSVGVLCACIAFFFLLHNSIAARGCAAECRAQIVIVRIAVVTLFAILQESIATAGGFTVITATVCSNAVAIVAFLARLQGAIATARSFTECRASVRVESVSIITFFARLNDTISACCRLTRIGARIDVYEVAVIALFPLLHDAIAAHGAPTRIGTGIFVDLVAVVTFFTGIKLCVAASCNRDSRQWNSYGRLSGWCDKRNRRSDRSCRRRRSAADRFERAFASTGTGAISARRRSATRAATWFTESHFDRQISGDRIGRICFGAIRLAFFTEISGHDSIATREEETILRAIANAIALGSVITVFSGFNAGIAAGG